MMIIKLMPDYRSWPLWWEANHEPGNIDPELLPLTVETRDRLRKWAAAYDATLNWDDPISSGFVTNEEKQAFQEEGEALWRQLQAQLEGQYCVVYQGPSDRRPRYPEQR